MNKLITTVPFAGFYETRYSGQLDDAETNEAEYLAEREAENHLGVTALDADEFADVLFHVTDYQKAHLEVAHAYVDALNEYAMNECRIDLSLEFESMTSPREYNFTTDRIFAYISLDTATMLLNTVNRDVLTKVIEDTFTSCSGFISSYSNDVDDWVEKPIDEWDHNELGTLLLASIIDKCDNEDFGWTILDHMIECGVFDEACSSAVNKNEMESRVSDLRDKKALELDPDYIPRCTQTIDMFNNESTQ